MERQENTCAICLNSTDTGGRQALFTAECSHTFHFQCITSNVAHGNLVCPLCKAQWKELPFGTPHNPIPSPRGTQIRAPFFPGHEPLVFNDDDPVDSSPQTQLEDMPQQIPTTGTMELKTYTEYPAVAKSLSKDDFGIVIHLKAPGTASEITDSARAPLDLVTVLDVSGSMAGAKLNLLKQAMNFVIQNLGPADRLSIISFSSRARRLNRLTRMSNEGMQQALDAVNSLTAGGGTNIAEGLKKGAKVLEERQYKNPVNSIILLSDGQDTYTVFSHSSQGSGSNYDCLLPPSILHPSGRPIPIHTFGFGSDHDSLAMHRIAEASGGTFSFIEDASCIQDAFAQCIGGLLSVVAQETHITLESANRGVKISGIKSGSYESCVENGGLNGSIDVGDLYADEQRSFLFFVNVPRSGMEGTTKLIKVNMTYRDAATASAVELGEQEVSIERPETVENNQICIEVEREKVRIQATENMVAARAAAERGEMRDAVEILESWQRTMETSEAARVGDPSCGMLQQEIKEMGRRMSSRECYAKSGRAYALAGISAHSRQRATTRSSISSVEPDLRVLGSSGPSDSHSSGYGAEGKELPSFRSLAPSAPSAPSLNYQTPAMRIMLQKSQSSWLEPSRRDKLP
ncbi:Zinc finger (C3HC4-type RING finger) family protein [Rhynchospora pubera]|uniref:Zinc finger (C3HC4-type RING finger) family protein n=1 Tax=Rhynchospora pubera TaxID=906938 RepID=A0AAV8F0A2_9POAL|nr:Zinc finger (C3HC4-type RING finger) family protein [Rhynchospora pubera]